MLGHRTWIVTESLIVLVLKLQKLFDNTKHFVYDNGCIDFQTSAMPLTVSKIEWEVYVVNPMILDAVSCVIIGSCNGLASVWCQAITWTNDDLLSIGPSGATFTVS